MHNSFFRTFGTSLSTENDSTADKSSKESNTKCGPDNEFLTTCRRMFSSPRPNSDTVPKIPNLRSASKSCKDNNIIVPVNPKSRRVSVDENSKNGVRFGEVVSASILELYFLTLDKSQRDKIRTLFVDILSCAGLTPSIVFSTEYEQTRTNMAYAMQEHLRKTFNSLKMSNPAIDDSLTQIVNAQHFPKFYDRYSEDFEELKEIGTGGFGKVYQSRSKLDGQLYAIKKIPLKKTFGKVYEKMLEECRFHARLQHPNIVRYHNAFVQYSYKSDIRLNPPTNSRTSVRIETLSTASSSLPSTSDHSTTTPPGVTIEEYDSDNDSVENEKDDTDKISDEEQSSSKSSSSSEESKGKGFWAKQQSPHSFSSFDTTENENGEDDNESIKSGDSMDSSSALKLGQVVAKNDINDVFPKELQLAVDIPSSSFGCNSQEVYATLFIQMELCHITLDQYIRNRQKEFLPIDSKFNEIIAEGLLSAIEFLHRNNVVHRDIKPSNIFLKYTPDKKPIVMLGDFGLARSIVEELAIGESIPSSPSPHGSSKLTSGLGTYLYAAPEQLHTKEYSLSADIYSAGVVIYELYHDFKTGSERAIILQELRKSAELSSKFKQAWPEICPILSSMITKSPNKRLEAGILLTKFKQLKEQMCHETEIQRLHLENQKLRDEAAHWKEKYLELERKFNLSQQHISLP
uniref:Protein kinase domain-containing protein n=1 Tax=Panagrolaimus sp. ES5 TaxID=591445 RepID=A0AC34FAS2_9BILA